MHRVHHVGQRELQEGQDRLLWLGAHGQCAGVVRRELLPELPQQPDVLGLKFEDVHDPEETLE